MNQTKIEWRACGRFSAVEVAALMGNAVADMRSLGCPEYLMLRVLESRARKMRESRVRVAGESEAEALKRRFAQVGAGIQADRLQEVTEWINEPPKPRYGPGGLGI